MLFTIDAFYVVLNLTKLLLLIVLLVLLPSALLEIIF